MFVVRQRRSVSLGEIEASRGNGWEHVRIVRILKLFEQVNPVVSERVVARRPVVRQSLDGSHARNELAVGHQAIRQHFYGSSAGRLLLAPDPDVVDARHRCSQAVPFGVGQTQ